MLLDHMALVWFPDAQWIRWLGRLALPVYVQGVVVGSYLSMFELSYLLRLVAVAVVSEVPYYLLFGHWGNMVWTLVLIHLGVMLWKNGEYLGMFCSAWLAWWFALPGGPFPVMMAMALMVPNVRAGAYWGLQMIWSYFTSVLIMGHLSLMVLWALPELKLRKMPQWAWLTAYPAHMALFAYLRG